MTREAAYKNRGKNPPVKTKGQRPEIPISNSRHTRWHWVDSRLLEVHWLASCVHVERLWQIVALERPSEWIPDVSFVSWRLERIWLLSNRLSYPLENKSNYFQSEHFCYYWIDRENKGANTSYSMEQRSLILEGSMFSHETLLISSIQKFSRIFSLSIHFNHYDGILAKEYRWLNRLD